MVGSFRCSIIGASRIFPPRFTAVRRRPPSPPPQFVGPDMSNEPVAPGLEPPPPPPAAPPRRPARSGQGGGPRFRPVWHGIPRRLARPPRSSADARRRARRARGVPDLPRSRKADEAAVGSFCYDCRPAASSWRCARRLGIRLRLVVEMSSVVTNSGRRPSRRFHWFTAPVTNQRKCVSVSAISAMVSAV